MGFFDSVGRSITGAMGFNSGGMADALKAQQKASAAAQAKSDAETKRIKDKEKIEKDKLEGKKMRGLKRKFGGSGLMSGSEETNTTLGA